MGQPNSPCHKKDRQSHPHKHSKPTRLVHKLTLGKSGIRGLLEERNCNKREKEHSSKPKSRSYQMKPNKNEIKKSHLLDCNEIDWTSLVFRLSKATIHNMETAANDILAIPPTARTPLSSYISGKSEIINSPNV